MSSGCSTTKPLEIFTKTIEVKQPPEKVKLPNPAPTAQHPFKWKVLTDERLPNEDGWVYYCLKVEGYENLARNMTDLDRWVAEAMWRLGYYRGDGQLDGQEIEQE